MRIQPSVPEQPAPVSRTPQSRHIFYTIGSAQMIRAGCAGQKSQSSIAQINRMRFNRLNAKPNAPCNSGHRARFLQTVPAMSFHSGNAFHATALCQYARPISCLSASIKRCRVWFVDFRLRTHAVIKKVFTSAAAAERLACDVV